MDKTTADFYTGIAMMVFNFGLIALATYMVAVYNWSLWTYVGFALFMLVTKNTKNDD